MAGVNEQTEVFSGNGQQTLTEFIEKHYLPWCRENKAAPTANSYERIWKRSWQEFVGNIALTNLTTADVTKILTHHAKSGLGARSLSHIKWMLSVVYVYAISSGVVPKNPVADAKWVKVSRVEKQAEYSLEQVLSMLRILEPLDMRAAVAVALCYFAALRPAEARGVRWADYTGTQLNIRRTVWRDKVGETKTEGSAASVPVIDPLRSLLEKLPSQDLLPDNRASNSPTIPFGLARFNSSIQGYSLTHNDGRRVALNCSVVAFRARASVHTVTSWRDRSPRGR